MPEDSCFPKMEDNIIQHFDCRMSWDKRRLSEGEVPEDGEKDSVLKGINLLSPSPDPLLY